MIVTVPTVFPFTVADLVVEAVTQAIAGLLLLQLQVLKIVPLVRLADSPTVIVELDGEIF